MVADSKQAAQIGCFACLFPPFSMAVSVRLVSKSLFSLQGLLVWWFGIKVFCFELIKFANRAGIA